MHLAPMALCRASHQPFQPGPARPGQARPGQCRPGQARRGQIKLHSMEDRQQSSQPAGCPKVDTDLWILVCVYGVRLPTHLSFCRYICECRAGRVGWARWARGHVCPMLRGNWSTGFLDYIPPADQAPCRVLPLLLLLGAASAFDIRVFGRGDDTVGSPHRAQISRFELFELLPY